MKLSDAMATGSPSSTPTRHTWSGSGAHRSTRYLATRARGRSSGVPLNASSITSATRRTSSPRSARTVTAPPPETGMSARSNALCSARRASAVARADAAASARGANPRAVCGVQSGGGRSRVPNAPERRSHHRETRRTSTRTRPRGTSFATMYHRRAPCEVPASAGSAGASRFPGRERRRYISFRIKRRKVSGMARAHSSPRSPAWRLRERRRCSTGCACAV